jgi:hypothetical protein
MLHCCQYLVVLLHNCSNELFNYDDVNYMDVEIELLLCQ